MSSRCTAREGLLGLAFDPNYATNGRFYVNYVAPGRRLRRRVSPISPSFTSPPIPISPIRASEVHPAHLRPATNNHNGGWIGFSPRPGDEDNLYIATGDGGNANDQGPGHIEPGGNAQNTDNASWQDAAHSHTTNRPAVIRFRPTIPLPARRPTSRKSVLSACAIRFATASIGLLGTFFIGDVGQDSREEIDAQPASNPGGGENYGWRVREGFIQNPAYPNDPVAARRGRSGLDYTHSAGQTVIGGYVYRGSKSKRCAAFMSLPIISGRTRAISPVDFHPPFQWHEASNFQDITSRSVSRPRSANFALLNPTSLGEDASGELYIVDYTSGNIFKIIPQAR